MIDYLFKIYSYTVILDDEFGLAVKYDITVYNNSYIALAERLKAKYVTLDVRLRDKLVKTRFSNLIITP